MLNWQEVPFVRLLIAFIPGLLLATDHRLAILPYWVLPSLFVASLGFLAWTCQLRLAYHYRWVSGCLILSLSGLTAMSIWQVQTPARQAQHYVQLGDSTQYYLFRIEAIKASSSGRTNRLEIAILGFGKQPAQLCGVTGSSFCYLPADFPFSVGQYYVARGQFQQINPPTHPGSFDFAQFMAQRGMVRQLYIPDRQVLQVAEAPISSRKAQLHRWSSQLQDRLCQMLPPRSAGLVSALVLGQKNQLDPEIKADYARVGAMHVLAVSGMHVGIVAMGLQFLLAFWRKSGPWPKFIKASISVMGIWFFALLAGGSPSVMRAASMFSLFTIGRELYLQKNVWNILAATALIMLCLDTRSLFAVGFQLSYTAVASIVYFQPRIYRLLSIRSRWLDYPWQLFSLGLAAQLGTAAISIHYFGQFPMYFWLSGLIIVPLATLALLLGLAVLVLGAVPLIGEVLSSGLHHLVQLMNQSMAGIGELPASNLSGLHLDGSTTLLVLGLLAGSVLYYHFRNPWLACTLLLGAGGLLFQQYHIQHKLAQQSEFLLYESRAGLAFSLIQQQKAQTFYTDSSVLAEIAYAKEAYLNSRRIKHTELIQVKEGSLILEWEGQRIACLLQPIDTCAQPLGPIDVLVLGSPFRKKTEVSIDYLGPTQILLHHSLSRRQKKVWREALRQKGTPILNQEHSNALLLEGRLEIHTQVQRE